MTDNTNKSPSTETSASNKVSWTLLDLNELIDTYWDVIAPVMREDGIDPETDRPTHAWLSENGFRGLIYALREYHDRTFGDFWHDDLDLNTNSERYDWGTAHGPTADLLKTYIDNQRERGGIADSSADTLRYRLARYVRAYREVNDTEDLLNPVAPNSDVAAYEATDAAWAAFDRLDKELAPQTMRRIHEAVDHWYAHLIRRKRAAVNPVAGLEDEYRWSRRLDNTDNTPANPALNPTHVQALYKATTSASERLLVVALCGWGLRTGEVAALHRSQLVLEPATDEVPYVAFDERKNGPGQVSILYGRDTAVDRLIELREQGSWNGYLFPSTRSASGHRTRQTMLNRFNDIANRAGLPNDIAGKKPVPQMARRFWYDAYSATQEAILTEVGEIAAEQGSASAEVVLQEYLSPERRRRLRRKYMRNRLSEALEEAATPSVGE